MRSRFSIAVVVVSSIATVSLAGSGSHGGNSVQIRMLEGRYQAVKALRDTAIDAVQDSDVKAFISSKGEALINDILGSKHVWSEGAQSNCAMTDLSLLSPIRLSMPTCRDDVKFTADAAKLLIHESVHHLGIEDEDFANRVALNAYELHKSKIPPTLSVECNLTYKLTADGAETRLKFLEPLQPNKEFIALRREVQVSGEAYQFYVYYDGHYSALSFYNIDSSNVFGADSEVEVGKLFSFYLNQAKGSPFALLSIDCNSSK